MAAYLLTGPSGAGKTTAGKYLAGRGYKVIETDHEPGLSGFYDRKTGTAILDYSFPLSKNNSTHTHGNGVKPR